MRKVNLSDGSRIDVRQLTRGEIRAGKEAGLKYIGINITADTFDELLDYCLGCQFEQSMLDNIANLDLHALFRAVIAETWGDKAEEKNSDPSGSGSQTANESTTAGTAENQNASGE